ncbi:hypothetical protein [uncultured phage MedDCM-OCT-S04-C1161]|nr:hypothetical protein [uncultured phage MedDCM-OCT-S04-C1035]ADD94148.1 hypothetical protein [uncultured phage MedDCM-OCT-S04-C1161]ADD94212.1 hypothetical protein [uncultured phage MedDCM-OCT-S04-C1227]
MRIKKNDKPISSKDIKVDVDRLQNLGVIPEWNHKYIGFHNQKEVVSTFNKDKFSAEQKCKELLLNYFHEITPGLTKMPLEYYNGVVAYVGEKIN